MTRRRFTLPTRSDERIRQEVDEEFAFHLDMRIEALQREGLSPEAARAQAAAEFGDQRRGRSRVAAEDLRVERRFRLRRWLAELRQDASYAARVLRRAPGFTMAAIATLTIAIGANTAVFSIVNALLLKPLPVQRPDRLLRIEPGQRTAAWTAFTAFRERTGAFADVAALKTVLLGMGEPGATYRAFGEAVSANYFLVMGVNAALGRPLLPSDGALEVVVLSDRAWRTRFNADPSIVGRRITLDGRGHEVVGGMPPLFRGLAPAGWIRDFWVTVESLPGQRARLQDPTFASFEIVGRLRDDVDASGALAAARGVAEQVRREEPRIAETLPQVTLVPVSGIAPFRGVGALVPVFLFVAVLASLAAMVLLIGSANLAGLLLGRATARRQELAVRVALGAGRGRIVRQLLTESLVLALAGGAGGVVLAIWLTRFVHVATRQLPFPLEFDLSVDWRVLAYTLLVSTGTALIFGLVPARRAARTDVVSSLKDDVVAGTRQRARQVLSVAQVAACAALLAWALLFAKSLLQVTAVDPGFDSTGVLLAEVVLGADTPREQSEAQFMEVQQAVAALPLVESVGMSWAVPLTLSGREGFPVFLEGADRGSRGRPVMANRLTPGWFKTLRIPLIAGRDFTWQDAGPSAQIAVVNKTLADRFWGGQAIGKRLRFYGRRDVEHDVEVVGVVGDSKYWTLGEESSPTVYLPIGQEDIGDDLTLHVRTPDFSATAKAIGRDVQRIAPRAIVQFRSMSDATAVARMPARVGAAVTGAFAGVAVLLSALGIYGLVAYVVVQRTREIGVRKAIGAGTWDILRMVLRSSLVTAAAGLLIGLGVAVAAAPALGGLIVGVSPADPAAFGTAAAVVALAVLAASAIPAWRAARVDALSALRQQ